MIALCLFLIFLGGFLLISRLSLSITLTERVGFAFPVGLAVVTFLMMLLDWVRVPLTATTCQLITVAVLLVTAATLVPKRRQFLCSLQPKLNLNWFNALWLLLLILLVYVEYGNLMKTLYFPVYDRDSMAGFDTIGFVAAQEHTYSGMSIFAGDYMPKIHQAGSCISYLPMLQLAYAYVYTLGAETSKIIIGLFYLSFIIGFYGLTRRASNPTAAMLATLATVFTPEMLSEGIVFGATAGVLVLIQCLRRKASWLSLIAPFATLIPTVIFSIYAAANGLTSESALITHPFWDAEKASEVWRGAWSLIGNTQFYGWAFVAALLALLADSYYIVKERNNLCVLGALVLSIVLYYIVLYHVEYKWDSLSNVLAYSAKRYMFCYVPMAWYYVVTCKIVRQGFDWIERTCGLVASKS